MAIFLAYKSRLGGLANISFMPEPAYGRSNNWLTCIGFEGREQVEDLVMNLREQRIEASPMWKPMHQQGLNQDLRVFGGKNSSRIHSRFFSLPSGSALKEAELERVCEAVRSQLLVAS